MSSSSTSGDHPAKNRRDCKDAAVADPILAKTGCAEQAEQPPRAEQQRELRQRVKSVASLLIALGSELPDPSELADPAQGGPDAAVVAALYRPSTGTG
jgi:hypothetical protein